MGGNLHASAVLLLGNGPCCTLGRRLVTRDPQLMRTGQWGDKSLTEWRIESSHSSSCEDLKTSSSSALKHQRFGLICRVHFQDRRISQVRKYREAGSKLFVLAFMLVSRVAYSSTLKVLAIYLPKRLSNFYGLHSAIPQKTFRNSLDSNCSFAITVCILTRSPSWPAAGTLRRAQHE
jgi:hypothetical protein